MFEFSFQKNLFLFFSLFLIVLSVQDIKTLLDVDKQKVMPLYPSELLKYFKQIQNSPFQFVILDCRLKRKEMFPSSISISKFTLDNSEV